MEKKKVSALLAQELVNRSPKLKPLYANANGEVVFNAKDEVQVAEVLMKAPAFFRPAVFCSAVKAVAKQTNQKFCRLALEYFQKKLSFEAIVNFYCGETLSLLNFQDSYDIKTFFIKKSGCFVRDLERPVSSPVIPRTLLIDLVEALEFLTGRPLSSEDNQPLAYLDSEATFADIAEYFSAGSNKVNDIRARILKALPPTKEQLIERFRTKTAVIFSQQVGEKLDEDFLKKKVKQLHPVGFGPQEWDLAVAWTEDELDVQVFHRLSTEISDDSTVRDLLDLFCKTFEQKLK